ncbi:dihydrodipicolinate synthase family protein [Niastella populi]|uniref:Dihydrodipicolinate synthase family protein n=1 Tax=Niastella populi TaxID=550983 RepID=A0A1V9FN73_9BACT|nr:dihydrodipicolinate synthase family protein [Niastella populi]OQP59809.1 dihydrodipicolinate synthase family protein [Niastella populi]
MQNHKKFKGVVVPAVTPLTAQLTLDLGAVEKMMVNFRQHQVIPFILGTTGEAVSLPQSVKLNYLQAAAHSKHTWDEDELYVGISSNVLEESVAFAHQCFEAGVDVVVATLPNYYPLTPGQMKAYFEQLANSVPGPLMIYNIPSTVHMSVPLDVVEELSHHPNIVGLKDSERNEERLQTALKLWANRSDFSYFAGWAAQSAQTLLKGGDGIIPSTGNFAPGLYNELYNAAVQGDAEKAYALQKQSDVLGNVYQGGKTLGESLWALKVLMKKEGLCDTYMMPPLHQLPAEEEQKVINNLPLL